MSRIDLPVSTERSALMSRVRGKHSKPERAVRSAAHLLGFRFRLHRRGLPGSPDLVFPRLKKIIFVHGCFWHRHPGCHRTTSPKTRAGFWNEKFVTNVERDARVERELRALGWKVMIVWECQTLNSAKLFGLLKSFLGPRSIRKPVTVRKARSL